MSSGGRTDGANNPDICNFWSQRQSQRSGFGRPGTFLPWRALTRATAKPRASRICNSGIQDTPVDSSTTVGIRQGVHQAASRCKSQGNALNVWTGGGARSAGTQPPCSSAPTSMPAACGWMRGIFSRVGVFCLPFFAIPSSRPGESGKSKGSQDSCCARLHAEAASGETVSSGLNQREALEERSQHAS